MYAFEFSQVIGVVPLVRLMTDRMRFANFLWSRGIRLLAIATGEPTHSGTPQLFIVQPQDRCAATTH